MADDHRLMQDARAINASEHFLLPFLEGRKIRAVQSLIAAYRADNNSVAREVARVDLLDELISDIKRIRERGNKIIEKLHEE